MAGEPHGQYDSYHQQMAPPSSQPYHKPQSRENALRAKSTSHLDTHDDVPSYRPTGSLSTLPRNMNHPGPSPRQQMPANQRAVSQPDLNARQDVRGNYENYAHDPYSQDRYGTAGGRADQRPGFQGQGQGSYPEQRGHPNGGMFDRPPMQVIQPTQPNDIGRMEVNNAAHQQQFYYNTSPLPQEPSPPFDQMKRPQELDQKPQLAAKPALAPKPEGPKIIPQEVPNVITDNRKTQPHFFETDQPRTSPAYPQPRYPDPRSARSPDKLSPPHSAPSGGYERHQSPDLPPPPPPEIPPDLPPPPVDEGRNYHDDLPPPPPPPQEYEYQIREEQDRMMQKMNAGSYGPRDQERPARYPTNDRYQNKDRYSAHGRDERYSTNPRDQTHREGERYGTQGAPSQRENDRYGSGGWGEHDRYGTNTNQRRHPADNRYSGEPAKVSPTDRYGQTDTLTKNNPSNRYGPSEPQKHSPTDRFTSGGHNDSAKSTHYPAYANTGAGQQPNYPYIPHGYQPPQPAPAPQPNYPYRPTAASDTPPSNTQTSYPYQAPAAPSSHQGASVVPARPAMAGTSSTLESQRQRSTSASRMLTVDAPAEAASPSPWQREQKEREVRQQEVSEKMVKN